MNAILDPILQSPRLKQYAEELQSYLKSEDEKRMGFYKTVTEQEKSEFINGNIITQSPVVLKHNVVVGRLYKLLSTFVSVNKLGFVGVEKILLRLTRNDFEPDICFFRKEKAIDFSDNTMFFPAPDFVVEVLSKSTEKIDRTIKMEDYALHGIKEYWIIDADKETIEQYLINSESIYELHVKVAEGIVHQTAIVGFDIEVASLFSDDICNATLKKLLNGDN
jgi:Uma2 family endonuclease